MGKRCEACGAAMNEHELTGALCDKCSEAYIEWFNESYIIEHSHYEDWVSSRKQE